jgi:hypothetical protein
VTRAHVPRQAQYVLYLKEDGHVQHWSESRGQDQGSMGAHVVTETDFYSRSDYQVRETPRRPRSRAHPSPASLHSHRGSAAGHLAPSGTA